MADTGHYLGADEFTEKDEFLLPSRVGKLSPEQKTESILKIARDQYNLTGENWTEVSKWLDRTQLWTEAPASLAAEVLGLVGAVAAGEIFGFVAAASGVILFPIASLVGIGAIKLQQHLMYALRGVAYAATAWVFDQDPPRESKVILGRLVEHGYDPEPYNSAWQQAVASTIEQLEADVQGKNRMLYKDILRSIADYDPAVLAMMLMIGMDDRLDGEHKKTWVQNSRGVDSVPYPN